MNLLRRIWTAGLLTSGLWLFAEVPSLVSLRLEGPDPPGRERVLKEHAPKMGAPFDPAAAGVLSDALLQAWRLEGYPLARVRWRAVLADAEGLELVLISEPGERGTLVRLVFEGNRAVTEEKLQEGLVLIPRTGRCNRFTGRDLLFLEGLGADAETLLAQYHRRGYMGAEIGQPAVEFVPELAGFEIRWPVTEGVPYRFGRVSLSEGTPVEVKARAEAEGVSEGERFSPEAMGVLRDRVMDALRGQGYGFAEFTVEPLWRDPEAEVDVMISVDTGPRVRLGELAVSGNAVTDTEVIRRELDLRPGDWFHAPGLRAFERRLAESGLFRSVEVQYRQSGPERFDIEVSVEEARTGRVETGVSYGTEEGPTLLVQAREVNFAPRPPFRGGGLMLEGSVQAGPEIVRVNGGLTFPRAGGSLWRVTGTGFYEDNAYLSDVYDQRNHGAAVVAAVPLSRRLSVFTGPQWTAYRLENVREGFAESAGVEAEVNLTGWQAGWVRDGTDRRFRPRRGLRLEQTILYGTERLGGDTEVLELTARGAVYFNPYGEHVLLFRGGVQSVDALGDTERVPVVLRTYLGGSATLRGFEYRSVSPLDADGVPVGGESAWWVSAEYLLPVLPRLDVSVYLDAGDVSGEALRFSGEGPVSNWGVGLVIRAENFPVRVDLAFPMKTLEGDPVNEKGEARLSFSAGYVF